MYPQEKNTEYDLRLLQSKIAKNDEAAFAALYGMLSRRLIAFAASLIHSKELAEEVVEDVFVKLWSYRKDIQDIDNIVVYLYVGVKNQSLNRLSEKARKLITEPFNSVEPEIELLSENPLEIMVTAEMLSKMNHAIEELPPRCKMIFKLVREDGLKYKEVASILNISVNTIDVQMAIAVKRICESLGLPRHSLRKTIVPKKNF